MFTPASMAIPSADVVAAKWARNAGQAQQDYQLGIQNTDVDPTALAIAAIPRALQRYTEAVNSGKMANGLRRVGKAGWQQAALSKGVQNYATGVAASVDKFQSRIAPVLAFESTLQGRINSMPNITAADREARMLAWARGMREYTG